MIDLHEVCKYPRRKHENGEYDVYLYCENSYYIKTIHAILYSLFPKSFKKQINLNNIDMNVDSFLGLYKDEYEGLKRHLYNKEFEQKFNLLLHDTVKK